MWLLIDTGSGNIYSQQTFYLFAEMICNNLQGDTFMTVERNWKVYMPPERIHRQTKQIFPYLTYYVSYIFW